MGFLRIGMFSGSPGTELNRGRGLAIPCHGTKHSAARPTEQIKLGPIPVPAPVPY